MTQTDPSSITSLLVYFNVNAFDPDQLSEDLAQNSDAFNRANQEKALIVLNERLLGIKDFRMATGCIAKSGAAAQAFFQAVYDHAYEGGEMPDIDDYTTLP